MLTDREAARFASKHRKQGGCWIWQGALDEDGYGTFYLRRMNRRAHRVAWFLLAETSTGMVVNHTAATAHASTRSIAGYLGIRTRSSRHHVHLLRQLPENHMS